MEFVEKLQFKCSWVEKGEPESWEDEEELAKADIARFVQEMLPKKAFPRPGDVDLVTGGPPCQGISGYNMCRNYDDPLSDPKNRQVHSFSPPVAQRRPYSISLPIQPPCNSHSPGNSVAEVRAARCRSSSRSCAS
jgi:site-specific DNA-cytosine methylase